MSLTTDPNHPDLQRGPAGGETEPRPQNKVYLVLSEEERSKGFLKPVRNSYVHLKCNVTTSMGNALSETYARDPWFYGLTFCAGCLLHRPLAEFEWLPDREPMDPAKWSPEEIERLIKLREQSEAKP